MTDALAVYFDGEKNAGLFLAGLGTVALVAAAILFPPRFQLRAFAVTLGVVALAEIALGAGLYLRTDPQVAGLRSRLAEAPERFQAEEGARMARVQRTFVVIEYVEAAILVLAAAVALTQKARPGLTGAALALLVHAAVLLAFDLVAERRGAAYLARLERSDVP
jgi:hypothetical protein